MDAHEDEAATADPTGTTYGEYMAAFVPLQPDPIFTAAVARGELGSEPRRFTYPLAGWAPPAEIFDVRRLNLNLGDRLAIVAPDWVDCDEKMVRFAKAVHVNLADYAPTIKALVFPPGTDLAVVSARQISDAMADAEQAGGQADS